MEANDRILQDNLLQNVTIEGRKKIIITGVQEVSRFDEDEIVVETTRGTLRIQGNNFRMEKFSLDTGEVTAVGFFTLLEYENDEPAERRGFLSRLFG